MNDLPRRLHTTTVERAGVNCVRGVVEAANSIFHEIAGHNDYGNDAFIQIVDGEAVTGTYVLAQVKSGRSYCDDEYCYIPATRSQLSYWRDHKLRVVGIVYDPVEECAYWQDITLYLKNHPEVMQQDSHRIKYDKEELSRFDDATFRDFFRPWMLGRAARLDHDRSVRFALSDDFELHSVGLRSLFYQFRNEESTWEHLEHILRARPSATTDPIIAYFLAHAPGHGDIYWHEDNILNESVRQAARQRIASWDVAIVRKLIELVEEAQFDRGSIGQSVRAVVELIDEAPGKIQQVLSDPSLHLEQRTAALYLYCFIAQEAAVDYLSQFSQSNDPLREEAVMLLEHLRTEGFFYA